MANSDSKGKRGERELCRKLRSIGFGAIRSAQVTGAKDHSHSSDIITSLDPVIRFEVKRGYEDMSVPSAQFVDWWQQATDETPPHKEAVIAWRKNRQPWRFYFLRKHTDGIYKLAIGMGNFLQLVSEMTINTEGLSLSELKVDDPETWKTTDTFS